MAFHHDLLATFRMFKRATNIRQSLGARQAAGYLRNRNVGLSAALIALGFGPERAKHVLGA